MPLWPGKTPRRGRPRAWAGILAWTLAMVGSAILIPLFATQTAAMLALATAVIVCGPGGPGARSQNT